MILLFLQGRHLDLHLHDFPLQLIQFRGHTVQFRLDQGTGLIHQVDGLVRQKSVGNITVGKHCGAHQGIIHDFHPVIDFIALLNPPQNGYGILHGGLLHHNRLEPSLQGGILLDILPVLVQGSGADAVQFSPGQHWLKHVSRVQRAVRLSRAHNGMQFVYKQNDLSVTAFHILQHRLQTLLELPPVFGACHQGSHVQGKNLLVFQPLGHVSPHNPLGQSFHHRCLAHTRFPHQHGIIFGLSGQNPDDIAYLRIPSDHRVHLLVSGLFHQLLSVFFQSVISGLRIVAGNSLIPPDRGQCLQKTLPGDTVLFPYQCNFPVGIPDHGQE